MVHNKVSVSFCYGPETVINSLTVVSNCLWTALYKDMAMSGLISYSYFIQFLHIISNCLVEGQKEKHKIRTQESEFTCVVAVNVVCVVTATCAFSASSAILFVCLGQGAISLWDVN